MGNLAFEHGGNISQAERIYKRRFIDFSANINPLGLPFAVESTLHNNFHRLLHYPDLKAEGVSSSISKYWPVKRENLLIGSGSTELIYLLIHAFRPKHVLVFTPTFSEYERAARCVRSKVSFIRLEEKESFAIKKTKPAKADMLFLCNPNNPTGNLIFKDSRIIDALPARLIVVDEAFMDFLPDEKKHSLIRKAEKDKRIVVLRSFTKFFALPGLRIGYLVAHRGIITKLRKYQMPWSVNCFAQLAAKLALKDREYIDKTRQFIEKERRFLIGALSKSMNLICFPSVVNFLLVKINDSKLTSSLLNKRLARQGILIRDCANFRGLNNKFIRIAVRSRRENLSLIKALRRII